MEVDQSMLHMDSEWWWLYGVGVVRDPTMRGRALPILQSNDDLEGAFPNILHRLPV
jgi:hypothetical protein